MVVGRVVGHECLHLMNRQGSFPETRDSDKASMVISDHNRVLSAQTLDANLLTNVLTVVYGSELGPLHQHAFSLRTTVLNRL